jgi:hypothetical protein
VRARAGYYAIPAGFELLSPEEYQVVAQWRAEAPPGRIPLFLRAGAFRETDGKYRVPVVIEVPTAAVQFEKAADTDRARFEILGLVRSPNGELLMRFGGRTQFTANRAEYEALKAGSISFLNTLQLPAGAAYSFEVLVKDLLSGKVARGEYGIYLREPEGGLALSPILLARDAEKAGRAGGQGLTVNGVQILPSARCAFRNGDNLIFYLEVYNPRLQTDQKTDLEVQVFLQQGARRVNVRVPPYRLTQAVTGAPPHVTVARYVLLSRLDAGDYMLVVNISDGIGQTSETAHASFTVVD